MPANLSDLVLAHCDCGTSTRVPRAFVGEHCWWKCTRCLDRDHDQFVVDHPQLCTAAEVAASKRRLAAAAT